MTRTSISKKQTGITKNARIVRVLGKAASQLEQ